MPRTIGVTYFLAHMGEILKAVHSGETVHLSRRGKLVARVEPYDEATMAIRAPRRARKYERKQD